MGLGVDLTELIGPDMLEETLRTAPLFRGDGVIPGHDARPVARDVPATVLDPFLQPQSKVGGA